MILFATVLHDLAFFVRFKHRSKQKQKQKQEQSPPRRLAWPHGVGARAELETAGCRGRFFVAWLAHASPPHLLCVLVLGARAPGWRSAALPLNGELSWASQPAKVTGSSLSKSKSKTRVR